MTKRFRQGTILQIIEDQEIATQDELVDALTISGISVTQTTVSRDIAELELTKVRGENGRLTYVKRGARDHDQMNALSHALKSWVLKLEASGNLVVATTPNGYADPLAQAIDQSGHPKVLGTIAGENTVLIIASEGTAGIALQKDLSGLADIIVE